VRLVDFVLPVATDEEVGMFFAMAERFKTGRSYDWIAFAAAWNRVVVAQIRKAVLDRRLGYLHVSLKSSYYLHKFSTELTAALHQLQIGDAWEAFSQSHGIIHCQPSGESSQLHQQGLQHAVMHVLSHSHYHTPPPMPGVLTPGLSAADEQTILAYLATRAPGPGEQAGSHHHPAATTSTPPPAEPSTSAPTPAAVAGFTVPAATVFFGATISYQEYQNLQREPENRQQQASGKSGGRRGSGPKFCWYCTLWRAGKCLPMDSVTRKTLPTLQKQLMPTDRVHRIDEVHKKRCPVCKTCTKTHAQLRLKSACNCA
jgi:hypothetical protein